MNDDHRFFLAPFQLYHGLRYLHSFWSRLQAFQDEASWRDSSGATDDRQLARELWGWSRACCLAQLADGMAFPEAVKNSYGKAAEELVTQWAQASGR